jgi:hypothetical protein
VSCQSSLHLDRRVVVRWQVWLVGAYPAWNRQSSSACRAPDRPIGSGSQHSISAYRYGESVHIDQSADIASGHDTDQLATVHHERPAAAARR